MRQRAPQQKLTPDVQTGCVCCASGDGRFGGPIWWNTPTDDSTETKKDNRAVWVQEGEEEEEEEVHEGQQQEGPASRKRPLENTEEEELDPEVKKRLEMLKST